MGGFYGQLFCGFVSSITFKPLVYFLLKWRGAFPEADESVSRWMRNAIWLCIGGIVCLASLVTGCAEGFELSFAFGCFLGIAFSMTWWIVFMLKPEGKACIIYMCAQSLENELRKRRASKSIGVVKAEEMENDIKCAREYAKKVIRDGLDSKTDKLSKKLADSQK